MKIARIILYVKDIEKITLFYKTVFDMREVGEPETGWRELQADGCNIGFQESGTSCAERGRSLTKIVFEVDDVASAKADLESKGLKLGAVRTEGKASFSNGRDPEGNALQISNRGL